MWKKTKLIINFQKSFVQHNNKGNQRSNYQRTELLRTKVQCRTWSWENHVLENQMCVQRILRWEVWCFYGEIKPRVAAQSMGRLRRRNPVRWLLRYQFEPAQTGVEGGSWGWSVSSGWEGRRPTETSRFCCFRYRYLYWVNSRTLWNIDEICMHLTPPVSSRET